MTVGVIISQQFGTSAAWLAYRRAFGTETTTPEERGPLQPKN